MSLRRLLDHFNIPYQSEYLHCAGNDAHYTIRVLLAMLGKQIARLGTDSSTLDEIQHFSSIVHDLIPAQPALKRRGQKVEECDSEIGETLAIMWGSDDG